MTNMVQANLRREGHIARMATSQEKEDSVVEETTVDHTKEVGSKLVESVSLTSMIQETTPTQE